MEKIKASVWLKETIIDATNRMREQIANGSADARAVPMNEFFNVGDLKRNDNRLTSLRKLLSDLGLPPALDGFTLDMLVNKMEAYRFALMRCMTNPNGHNYGTSHFIVARTLSGYRQDGSSGNSFPASDMAEWKVPDERDAQLLADKYIEMLKIPGSTDWKDYIKSASSMIETFVDFSEFKL